MHVRALDPRITHLVTSLAATMAILIALLLPTAYYLAGRSSLLSSMQARAILASTIVSETAMANAELWMFEEARIRGRLSQLGDAADAEERRVIGANGQLVAQQGQVADRWILSAVEPVFDSGVPIGRVEIVQSQHSLMANTLWISLAAAAFGLATFFTLRLLPLRLLRNALSQVSHLASHDPLTGLPNRRLFQDRLQQALARLKRDGTTLAVMCLDLDNFKHVNDTLGHGAGDLLLGQVTRRLMGCLRSSDTLARLGGDEFAILQIGTSQQTDSEALASRLIAAIAEPFDLNGHQVLIGTSVGVSLRSGASPDLAAGIGGDSAILQEADTALYRAKTEGRGTYRFFQAEMNEKLRERRSLEADLRQALALQQFELHYQPQLDLVSRRILGAEALVRWHHPVRGMVRPDQFIGVAEDNGLICRIGTWVIREACREAATWPVAFKVAVNVSPVQFRKPEFVEIVAAALSDMGLAADRLELEVTEGVLLSDTDETLATLQRLRALGVSIAMDDFGTGYSSLGYLQKFAFDKIKIDQSFVQRLGTDANATAIISAILGMAKALGIRVNAEGVEDENQALMLQEAHCEEVQGFHFSRPIRAVDFRALLSDTHPKADGLPDVEMAGSSH